MWKFTFKAPSRQRILGRGFFLVKTETNQLWFSESQKKWVDVYSDAWKKLRGEGRHSNAGPISDGDRSPRTFRGIKRYLKKHPELQGHKVLFYNFHEWQHISAEFKEQQNDNT